MVHPRMILGEGLRAQRPQRILPLTHSFPLHDRAALSLKGRGHNNVRPLLRTKKGAA
jgi:hypothetical protein